MVSENLVNVLNGQSFVKYRFCVPSFWGVFLASEVPLGVSDTRSSRLVGTDDQRSEGLGVQIY